MSMQPYILLCTVGISLERHLKKWRNKEMSAFAAADWEEAAQRISRLEPQDWSCGAEIHSIHALLAEKDVTAQPEIHFFHSDTDAGRDIGRLLKRVYELRGWRDNAVRLQVIEGLRDSEPKLFRTQGLRNLKTVPPAAARRDVPPADAPPYVLRAPVPAGSKPSLMQWAGMPVSISPRPTSRPAGKKHNRSTRRAPVDVRGDRINVPVACNKAMRLLTRGGLSRAEVSSRTRLSAGAVETIQAAM